MNLTTSHSLQPLDPGRFLPHHKILEAYSLQESKTQGLWVWKYNKSMDTILKTKDISDYAQEYWLLQSRVSFLKSPGSQISMALRGLWARTVGKVFPGKSDQHKKEVPKILSILLSKSSELMTCWSTRFTYITFFFLFATMKRKPHSPDTRIKGKLLS